jgi:hypothetical protein
LAQERAYVVVKTSGEVKSKSTVLEATITDVAKMVVKASGRVVKVVVETVSEAVKKPVVVVPNKVSNVIADGKVGESNIRI